MTGPEFNDYARRAFRFLSESYGFKEERVSRQELRDQPFQVRFTNTSTRVVVEGVHWGFGVYVGLVSRDQALMREKTYSLDDLLTIRAPDFQAIKPAPQDGRDIQEAQVDQYAEALKDYASDVLEGDFAIFPRLAAAIAERRMQYDGLSKRPARG